MSEDVRASEELNIEAILDRVRAELPTSDRSLAAQSGSLSTNRHAVFVPLLEDSPPARSIAGTWTLEDFEALDEEEFLHTAYRVILGRDIDQTGLAHYLPALRNGQATPAQILHALRSSPEGEARGISIPHLKRARYLDRAGQIPFLGPLFQVLTSGRHLKRLQRRLAASDKRQREIVTAANDALKAVRRHLARTAMDASAARAAADRMEDARHEIAASRQLIAQETLHLQKFIEQATASLPPSSPAAKQLRKMADHTLDSLYLAFENRFRGTPGEIAARQAHYLGMFQSLEPVAKGGLLIDIGCGRGEWLDLLKQANISARGIDLNSAMVEEAKAKGLDVIEANAIHYLRELPENSLAAITGFHIVEHLTFDELVQLFDEAWRTLAPGGAILFETPNPENLVVGACTFHYDPTHIRPLPPDFLRFLAEARGYSDARIIRKEEDCNLSLPESGFTPSEINDWFRQPPDYALFARKQEAIVTASDES